MSGKVVNIAMLLNRRIVKHVVARSLRNVGVVNEHVLQTPKSSLVS